MFAKWPDDGVTWSQRSKTTHSVNCNDQELSEQVEYLIAMKQITDECMETVGVLSSTFQSQQQIQICSRPLPTLHSDQAPLEGPVVLWCWCCCAHQDSMMSSGSRDWKVKSNEPNNGPADYLLIHLFKTLKILFFMWIRNFSWLVDLTWCSIWLHLLCRPPPSRTEDLQTKTQTPVC